jgi:hypothetical protein
MTLRAPSNPLFFDTVSQARPHATHLAAVVSPRQVFKRMDAKGMNLSVTERFKDRLVDEGYR